jgi:hypothetical protein
MGVACRALRRIGKEILPNEMTNAAVKTASPASSNKQSQAQEQVSKTGKNAPSETLSRCTTDARA